MKHYVLLVLMLAAATTSHAEEVRVFTDYQPVRVLKITGTGTNFETEASKAGLKGSFKDLDSAQLPSGKTDRNFWKLENGVIVVDEALKTASISERAAKKEQTRSAIAKLKVLGLTDDELTALHLKEE